MIFTFAGRKFWADFHGPQFTLATVPLIVHDNTESRGPRIKCVKRCCWIDLEDPGRTVVLIFTCESNSLLPVTSSFVDSLPLRCENYLSHCIITLRRGIPHSIEMPTLKIAVMRHIHMVVEAAGFSGNRLDIWSEAHLQVNLQKKSKLLNRYL